MSETENLFISNLLVAFKTLELHLSLFKNTAAEISTSWKDIENSILSQRESFMKTSFKVTKEISLDDLACILHVVPEMYTCTYQKEPSIATIDPLTQLVPSNLFIETVDRFGSNLSEEDDTKRHVSSTLERRKSHFRYVYLCNYVCILV